MTAQDVTDRRDPDQDAALEQAFIAGTLRDLSVDRRDDGAEVTLPTLSADAGASLQRDNATTPAVKANQHTIQTGHGVPIQPIDLMETVMESQ